jgi:hypothetical protein
VSRKIGILLLALGFSTLWYFSIAHIVSWSLTSDGFRLSRICAENKIPEGTVRVPGDVLYPGGGTTDVPIGFYCVYTMSDGPTLRTIHPDWIATSVTALPTVATLAGGVTLLTRRPRSPPSTVTLDNESGLPPR